MCQNQKNSIIKISLYLISISLLLQLSSMYASKSRQGQTWEKILGISMQDAKDFGTVRSNYCQKIRENSQYRSERIKLNQAYFNLTQRIFNSKQPQKELLQLVIKGELDRLNKLLSNNPKLINYRSQGDNYPIIYHAVRSGHYDIVDLILRMGCSLDFSKDKSTPMHCAAYYGHYGLIPLLLNFGIPTKIKNWQNSLPIQQACTPAIQKLLQNSDSDSIHELAQTLILQKLAINLINISQQKQIIAKKIILTQYSKRKFTQYEDAFHGTSFQNFSLIAKHGLKRPGDKIQGKVIPVVQGHIELGVKVEGIENWSRAVFLSPSIYYAGNPVYSKEHINNGNQVWLPIIQAKVLKGSYTEHDSTLNFYPQKTNQPTCLQYRVQYKNKNMQLNAKNIYRSQNADNVVAVSLLFVKPSFLNNNENYLQVTNLILNSSQQKIFRKNQPPILVS